MSGSNHPCTPGEVADLMAFLEPLRPERRVGVARMMFEEVGECACGGPVRRCDPRRIVGGRLCHLDCVGSRGRM